MEGLHRFDKLGVEVNPAFFVEEKFINGRLLFSPLPALIDYAARHTGVSADTLINKRRGDRRAADVRFAIMWVLKRSCGWSLTRVGRELGGRDHSTVHAGVKRADEMLLEDIEFLALVKGLTALLPVEAKE